MHSDILVYVILSVTLCFEEDGVLILWYIKRGFS